MKIPKLITYFLIAGGVYLVEFALVGHLGRIFTDYMVPLNYLVRIVGCVAAAILIRRIVFPHQRNFFRKFLLIATLIPMTASLIFLLLISSFNTHFLFLKLLADIITSLLGYIGLSKLLNDPITVNKKNI